jgi:HEAT repeat protein
MFVPPPLAPTLEAAFRDVAARSPEARAAALEVLSGVGDRDRDRALGALRTLILDEAAIVRVAALVAIGRLCDVASLDAVLARIEDEDATVREIAVITASELGGERAEAAVLAALESARPEIRFQAVAAIATVAPQRARGHLVRRLEDADPKVRAHAASALAQLGDHPASRRAIVELLTDPDRSTRRDAALALASLGDPSGVSILRGALDDPERAIAAAEALGGLGATQAADDLAAVARSFLKPLILKAATSAALAQMNDPRGIEGLRAVLRAMRADGRTYAVTAIGELGLAELADDVAALAERPRGADPFAIADTLAALAGASRSAEDALIAMSHGRSEAADRAREHLRERGA